MDLSSAVAKLGRGLKNLNTKWEEVGTVWTDKARRTFEEEHLKDIEQASLAVLREMDRLDQVLRQAQQECQEGRG